jgi:exopolyphosphatase/guanosine-5'-triphosphate,3'-diphosphate pyrophosphatase
MCRKYAVDLKNARHVANLAAELFDALLGLHNLAPDAGRLLETAAYLCNVGHYISDTGHHKHSAYIVSSSDMPGFTVRERNIVALLCRFHRKSMPAQRHDVFRTLPNDDKRIVQLLTPLLRLAVGLDSAGTQKVKATETHIVNNVVNVYVRGEGDLDLEMWAAEGAAEAFRQMYGVPMVVARARK